MFRLQVFLLACSSFAFAQLDSLALRSKLGSPLHRETFHVAAGFDMIVDYSMGGRVCRLQVPALMPTTENPARSEVMKQRMYAFLADLVPMSMRGLEKNAGVMTTGLHSMKFTEYENVFVAESPSSGDPFSNGSTITVTFKNEPCDR